MEPLDTGVSLSTASSCCSLVSLQSGSVYYSQEEWVRNYAACDVAKMDLEEWCKRDYRARRKMQREARAIEIESGSQCSKDPESYLQLKTLHARAFGTPNTCPSDFRTQQSETRGHLILDGGNRDLSILSRCKLHELSERTVGTHATCSSMAPEEDASSLARDDNKPSWTRISLSNNVDKWLSFGWREGRSSSLDCDGCSCNNNNNDAQQRRSPEKQRSSISGFLRSVGVRLSERLSLDVPRPISETSWEPNQEDDACAGVVLSTLSRFSVCSPANRCPTCCEEGLVVEPEPESANPSPWASDRDSPFESAWPPSANQESARRKHRRLATLDVSFSSRVTFMELLSSSALGQVWLSRYDGQVDMATKVSLAKGFEAEYAVLWELRMSPRVVQVVNFEARTVRGAALIMRRYNHLALQEELARLRGEVRAAAAAAADGPVGKVQGGGKKRVLKQSSETRSLAEAAAGRAGSRFLELAFQVAQAVQDVHNADAVHCNIQVSSLLWDDDREHVVLGSFSQARARRLPSGCTTWQDCTLHRNVPTPPELDAASTAPQEYSTSSDVWHLATCALEMWMGDHGNQLSPRDVPWDMPLRELWVRCLDIDPARRPSIYNVVEALHMQDLSKLKLRSGWQDASMKAAGTDTSNKPKSRRFHLRLPFLKNKLRT